MMLDMHKNRTINLEIDKQAENFDSIWHMPKSLTREVLNLYWNNSKITLYVHNNTSSSSSHMSWSWATCWPVLVSRIQRSLQRSAIIPSASWEIVFIRGSDVWYNSLSYPTVILTFSWYTLFSQTRKWPSHSGITVSAGMKEMPSLNMPVGRLKVAILPLDLPCSGPVTHSEETLTTGMPHRKKTDNTSFY